MRELIKKEVRIFDAALRLTRPEARQTYLDRVCYRNSVLRVRVEKLLAVQAQAERFFASAADGLEFKPRELLESMRAQRVGTRPEVSKRNGGSRGHGVSDS